MTYRHASVETIASELTALLFGLPLNNRACLTVEVETVPVGELVEAGVGFRMHSPGDSERFLFVEGAPATEGNHLDISMPWWTFSGEEATTLDQYATADTERSEGGWSDVGPSPDDVWLADKTPVGRWADWRLYLARCKREREERMIAAFDWLRRQRDAAKLRRIWRVLQEKLRKNFRACKTSNDWTALLLNKAQKEALERYYRITLLRLQ